MKALLANLKLAQHGSEITQSDKDGDALRSLSRRQKEVFTQPAKDLSSSDIANKMHVSTSTATIPLRLLPIR